MILRSGEPQRYHNVAPNHKNRSVILSEAPPQNLPAVRNLNGAQSKSLA
jgi:hypothetical protein